MASIGNELFKNWLKELQPIERAHQMGEIAKSQAAKGLKGSAIKASLAQLSQRCRVMLVPLTKQEINYFTRRKPTDKPQRAGDIPKDKCAVPSHTTCSDKSKSTAKEETKPSLNSSDTSTKASKFKNINGEVMSHCKKPYPNEKPNDKLKRKFEELFGNDPEELSGQNNNPINNQTGTNVNYVSTTLHLNIFTNGSTNESCNDEKEVKRKHHMVEKHKTKHLTKKLRIDVSLPNNDESYTEGNLNITGIQFSNKSFDSNTGVKKKSKQKRSSSKKSKRSKPKNASSNVSSPHNIVEEDSTIKELWSILGMESPTDRSESIKNGDPGKSVIDQHANDSSTHNIVEGSEATENTAIGNDPVCQISETFSLAHLSSDAPFGNLPSLSSIVNPNSKNKSVQENIQCRKEINERKECDTTAQKLDVTKPFESNKIGKIRVKSIDSLMNPETPPGNLLSIDPKLDLMPSTISEAPECSTSNSFQRDALSSGATTESLTKQNDTEANSGLGETEQSKKYFFTMYKFYFNNSVESKIPKLGEILHLAIGDEIRRKERIKAATQLSSQNFITEEKQRACADFVEVMKLRGEEFAPQFCGIFWTFEENSQITLFLALFYRILKHAIQIDSRHQNRIPEAKTATQTMLSLSSIQDSKVINILKTDLNEFVEQLNIISGLVDEFYLETTIAGQLTSANRPENAEVTVENLTYQTQQTNNLPDGNFDRSSLSKNTAPGSRTITPRVLPHTTEVRSVPSSLQSQGIVKETQNVSTPSKETPRRITPIGTVSEGLQEPVQKHPQVPTQKYVAVTKITLPTANSANNALNTGFVNSTTLTHTTIRSKGPIQSNTAQVSKGPPNHNSRTIAGNPVLVQLLDKPSKTNHLATSEQARSLNRSPNVILRLPLNYLKICNTSATPVFQSKPVPVLSISNNLNSSSVPNKAIQANSTQISSLNQSLPTNVHAATSQANVNIKRTYQQQQSSGSNTASRPIPTERPAVSSVVERQTKNLNNRDALSSDNVQNQVVPSSSHCHPFVKRMPISGKMKMFFGNS